MDTIDTVRLLAELEGEHCWLNHGPQTKQEDYPASDYIVIPFGDAKKEIQTPDRDLVVPVCLECAQALIGKTILCSDKAMNASSSNTFSQGDI